MTALVAIRVVLLAASAFMFLVGAAEARTGQEVKVAVAANFTEPAREIQSLFEKATGDRLVLSFGATGQFYAQISQGAPFEVLLSADKQTPAKAIAEGHAVAGTAFTYAIGKLVLFSKMPGISLGEAVLKDAAFARIAIANPATATNPASVAAVTPFASSEAFTAPLAITTYFSANRAAKWSPCSTNRMANRRDFLNPIITSSI